MVFAFTELFRLEKTSKIFQSKNAAGAAEPSINHVPKCHHLLEEAGKGLLIDILIIIKIILLMAFFPSLYLCQ